MICVEAHKILLSATSEFSNIRSKQKEHVNMNQYNCIIISLSPYILDNKKLYVCIQ